MEEENIYVYTKKVFSEEIPGIVFIIKNKMGADKDELFDIGVTEDFREDMKFVMEHGGSESLDLAKVFASSLISKTNNRFTISIKENKIFLVNSTIDDIILGTLKGIENIHEIELAPIKNCFNVFDYH